MTQQALIINNRDNVATALQPLEKAAQIHLTIDDRGVEVILTQAIPTGHKFALSNIDKGRAVIKYGEKIGTASALISMGDHVHLHNVEGYRGRGDKK